MFIDRFVTRCESQKSNRSGERHLVINLSDQEFDYINGHTIDGRFLTISLVLIILS